MKRVLFLSALLFLVTLTANATTIFFVSSQAGMPYSYNDGVNPTVFGPAVAITPNPAWDPALSAIVTTGTPVPGGSSWVSFAETGVNNTAFAAGQTVDFTLDLALPVAYYVGFGEIDVYTDDSFDLFVNGALAGSGQGYNLATGGPTPVDIAPYLTLGMTNTLLFRVMEVPGGTPFGLNFVGQINTEVPEPGSLMLLGTGLTALAGVVRRRLRR